MHYTVFWVENNDLLENINIYKKDLEAKEAYTSTKVIKTIIPIND